ncbi:hypothetical protein QOT17_001331 [Balamuthia mandrillaris]
MANTLIIKAQQGAQAERQAKAFMGWANFHLQGRGLHIRNLVEDMKDGLLLIALVEVVTGRAIPPEEYITRPTLEIQRINNVNVALKKLRQQGLTVTASAEDVTKGRVGSLLGLLWTVITKYELGNASQQQPTNGSSSVSSRNKQTTSRQGHNNEILEWVSSRVASYEPRFIARNSIQLYFPDSFRDGKVLACLVHSACSDAFNIDELVRERPDRMIERALNIAEKELGVPPIIEPEDVIGVNKTEEQCLLTYLAVFRAIALQRNKTQTTFQRNPSGRVKRKDSQQASENNGEDKDAAYWKRKYMEEREIRRRLEEQLAAMKTNSKGKSKGAEEGLALEIELSADEDKQRLESKIEQLILELELDLEPQTLKAIRRRDERSAEQKLDQLLLALKEQKATKSVSLASHQPQVQRLKELQLELELQSKQNAELREKMEEVTQELRSEMLERIRLEVALEEEEAKNEKRIEPALMATKRDSTKSNNTHATIPLVVKLQLDIEKLIRELYWRDGASLVHIFGSFEQQHEENQNFVDAVGELTSHVASAVEDICAGYSSQKPAEEILQAVQTLRDFRGVLKKEKNRFVSACNAYGKQVESKSQLEKRLRLFRDKLVLIARDKEACVPSNRALCEDIKSIKVLLQQDDQKREELSGYAETRVSAKNNVQVRINELRAFIDHHKSSEQKRLYGLVQHLKSADNKLATWLQKGESVPLTSIYVPSLKEEKSPHPQQLRASRRK